MAEKKTFYLTEEGLDRIKKEHEKLKKISLAKSKGESPKIIHPEEPPSEYLVYKEDQFFLNTRINELENILKNARLIKFPSKEKQNTIQLGATVLISASDRDEEFVIVGSLEANPSLGRISSESPVGKSLLGRKVGDKAVVPSPVKTVYKIKKIRYGKDS